MFLINSAFVGKIILYILYKTDTFKYEATRVMIKIHNDRDSIINDSKLHISIKLKFLKLHVSAHV
jgi:hypothetical protein